MFIWDNFLQRLSIPWSIYYSDGGLDGVDGYKRLQPSGAYKAMAEL